MVGVLLHGEGLAGAGLAVREYRGVVALKEALKKFNLFLLHFLLPFWED